MAVRTVLAEAGYAAVNNTRIDLLYRIIINSQVVLDPGPKVFHYHVRALAHFEKNAPPFVRLQI